MNREKKELTQTQKNIMLASSLAGYVAGYTAVTQIQKRRKAKRMSLRSTSTSSIVYLITTI